MTKEQVKEQISRRKRWVGVDVTWNVEDDLSFEELLSCFFADNYLVEEYPSGENRDITARINQEFEKQVSVDSVGEGNVRLSIEDEDKWNYPTITIVKYIATKGSKEQTFLDVQYTNSNDENMSAIFTEISR